MKIIAFGVKIIKLRIILLIGLFCLLFSGCGTQSNIAPAFDHVFYVAPTGDDINPGTLSKPWRTIQHAVKIAIAGNTVNILSGTYSSSFISMQNSGSPGKYITFQNYDNSIVDIHITDSNRIGINTNSKSYLKFVGLRISAPNNFYGIDVYRGSNIMIQNCYLNNCKAGGIYSESTSYLTVNGCEITSVGIASSAEMISMFNVSHFEINNCLVHDSAGAKIIGIDAKNANSNGSIHNNTIYNTSANGIYVDSGGSTSNIEIYDNLVYNCPLDSGISLNNENGIGSLSNIHVYNNIIYGCLKAFTVNQVGTQNYNDIAFINNTCYNNSSVSGVQEINCISNPAYMTNCIIRNNIIYSLIPGTYGISDNTNAFIVDHNLFYNSGGLWASANKLGTNAIQANPKFVNPPTNFNLLDDSPSIGAGSNSNAPMVDFIGIARPQHIGVDIGAYQYPAAASPLTVITNILPYGSINNSYSQVLAANGGTPPYTWAITSGKLPSGLSLSLRGTISGTPTTYGGPFNIIVQVNDDNGSTATGVFEIMISDTNLIITTASLLNGVVGVSYYVSLNVTGGSFPYTWMISSGTLPPGLSLSSNGIISGTPTTVWNSTSIELKVTDNAHTFAFQSYSIAILNPGGNPGSDKYKYVALTGKDSNPGTFDQPWLTLQYAADEANPGDIINIETGSYSSKAIFITRSGSANNYITFQNYNGGVVNINITDSQYGGISTNNQSYLKIVGLRVTAPNCFNGLDAYGGSNITFQNCFITNCKFAGIAAENAATFVTVDNCEVTRTNTLASEECISFYGIVHFEISNCVVHDPVSNQRIGIATKDGCANGIIDHNTVYNCSSNGIYVGCIGGDTSNIDVYDNLVHDCGLSNAEEGFSLEDEEGTHTLTNINFYNNIVYNCGRAFAMWQIGEANYINCSFINNTCYDNCRIYGGQEIICTSNSNFMRGCVISNNIIYSQQIGSYGIKYDAYGDGGLTIDHNIFFNSTGEWDAANQLGTNSIQADPLLISPPTIYNLQNNSPAIDAGTLTGAPSKDYSGKPRPSGSGIDIGALEYQSDTSY